MTFRGKVGTTLYAYAGSCGKVQSVDGPFGDVVSYAYDIGKRLTNVLFQGESRGYALDDLNRIAGVEAFGTESMYSYVGTTRRIAQLERGNGTLADYHYDALGRLTNLVNRAPGDVVLSSFGYTLDDADQRVQVRKYRGQIA